MAVVGKWCTGSGVGRLGSVKPLAAAGGRCVPDDGVAGMGLDPSMAVVGK